MIFGGKIQIVVILNWWVTKRTHAQKYLQWWRDILKKLLSMQAGLKDEFQHKWAFILMMTLKCFKTIKNSNDEMALVNIKAQKCLNNLSFKKSAAKKKYVFQN